MFLFLAAALGLLVIGQTVSWLTRFGAINYLGTIMVIVVVRELGPLIAALMVLARIGTANVIELGTARAMGEVEALEALGIDPIHYLVVPRVIGMAVGIFSLTVYLILGALVSGYLWAFVQDVPLRPGDYFRQLAGSLSGLDFALLGAEDLLVRFHHFDRHVLSRPRATAAAGGSLLRHRPRRRAKHYRLRADRCDVHHHLSRHLMSAAPKPRTRRAIEMRGVSVGSMRDLEYDRGRGRELVGGAGRFLGRRRLARRGQKRFSDDDRRVDGAGERAHIVFWRRDADLRRSTACRDRLQLGFVFEGGQLFNHLTIAENISLPLRYHRDLTEAKREPKCSSCWS